jgi:hypothetical protein
MAISDRQLQDEERKLIAYLWGLRAPGNALPPEIRVRELEDGGMGSLSFVSSKLRRSIGQVAGECSFPDADGVLVVAALLLDEDGDLYELDLWKVDFAPLIRIPDPASFSPLRDAPNHG